jgi:hypothetical protein
MHISLRFVVPIVVAALFTITTARAEPPPARFPREQITLAEWQTIRVASRNFLTICLTRVHYFLGSLPSYNSRLRLSHPFR